MTFGKALKDYLAQRIKPFPQRLPKVGSFIYFFPESFVHVLVAEYFKF